MYVVTFYSFKGGVGRSMAMMNCAAELAKRGRRILVVDFDLEAPGLETFDLPHSRRKKKGIVDYVTEYMTSNVAPSIEQYIYKSRLDKDSEHELWFMFAGDKTAKYSQKLNSINWQYLYEQRDGYFLFENLKAQWKEHLNPDYVFVDSRTGFTDVGAICTRQLPDAVVFLFFPNEQNLSGLSPIVDYIRENEQKLKLHFVTSNVPDLDDENRILEKRLIEFQQKLEYDEIASTIHHYPSLSLLNQEIFTVARPNSRLASEYRELVQEIQRENPEDRDGALSFLHTPKLLNVRNSDERINRILEFHGDDPEIIDEVTTLWEHQGRLEEANDALTRMLDTDCNFSNLLVKKSRLTYLLNQREEAVEFAVRASLMDGLKVRELSEIIHLLLRESPEHLDEISSWPSIFDLDNFELLRLANALSVKKVTLTKAEQLIRIAFEKNTEQYGNDLLINLVGQRKFKEALNLIDSLTHNRKFDIAIRFNKAMALWGNTQEIPVEQFEMVANSYRSDKHTTANNLQCMSLAFWAIGMKDKANELLMQSRQRLAAIPVTEFSCWTYLQSRRSEFVNDLLDQESMINGEDLLPGVICGVQR